MLDIILGKKNIKEIQSEQNLSKQTVYNKLNELILEISSSEEYKKVCEVFIIKNKNEIIEINNKTFIELQIKNYVAAFGLFCYKNKKNIIINGNIEGNFTAWYSNISFLDISKIIKETSEDSMNMNLNELFKLSNIKVTDNFIQFYGKEIFKPIKFTIKAWTDMYFKDKKEPIDKEKLFLEGEKFGFSKKKIYNLYHSNAKDDFVILGDKILKKDIFFQEYIKERYDEVQKIIEYARAICKIKNVTVTDASWVKSKIEEYYPDFKITFDKWEIKAILVDSDFFEKGVKLNIIYIENDKDVKSKTIEDTLEEILIKKTLPLALAAIVKELINKGRNSSYTYLTSYMQTYKNIEKMRYGWIHKNNHLIIEERMRKLDKLTSKEMIEILKEKYKAKNINELSKKTKIPSWMLYQGNINEVKMRDNLIGTLAEYDINIL